MNTKLTFGSFEIESTESNPTNQFLQELLNYTYKNILKEATNDSQLINIFFEYFHQDPNTRFPKHYQEIDYETVYARERFYSEEEEIQGRQEGLRRKDPAAPAGRQAVRALGAPARSLPAEAER